MDKISGIIPSNSRISTVDMKASGPARSGAPSFGREVGVPKLNGFNSPNTGERAMERFGDQAEFRSTAKDPRAEIVSKLSDKFFARQTQMAADEMPEIRAEARSPEEMVAMAPILQPAQTKATVGGIHVPIESREAEEMAVGQHLDVRA